MCESIKLVHKFSKFILQRTLLAVYILALSKVILVSNKRMIYWLSELKNSLKTDDQMI